MLVSKMRTPRILVLLRFLGTATSRRQAFRQIQPEHKVLDFLDKVGLGRPKDRATRRVVGAKRRDRGMTQHVGTKTPSSFPLVANEALPHPFDRGPQSVTRIIQIDRFEDLPDYGPVPEVAVIGRSNVGKSTLLNAVLGFTSHVQKAAVSDKPGETKKLQFFCIGSYNNKKSAPKLAIVDMPGYGFAFMSEELAKHVSALSKAYLCDRGSVLKRVLLILDARHGFKVSDTAYINELVDTFKNRLDRKPAWKLQIVLTKCDLLSRQDVARRVMVVREHLREKMPGLALSNLPIIMVSGAERRGIVQLQRELASLVPARPRPAETPQPASNSNLKSEEAENKEKVKDKPALGSIKEKSKLPPKKQKVRTPGARNDTVEQIRRKEMIEATKMDITDVNKTYIAVELAKKSIITKPVVDVDAAPRAGAEVTSLTMSDRLDAILGHYLEKTKAQPVEDSRGNTILNKEMSTEASSCVDYYGKLREKIRRRKGVGDADVSSNEAATTKVFRKARSEEDLRKLAERKALYRLKYCKHDDAGPE